MDRFKDDYNRLNREVTRILDLMAVKDKNHVPEYDWLYQHREEADTPEFQRRYSRFWRMNTARLGVGSDYCNVYFTALKDGLKEPPALNALTNKLYNQPTRKSGHKALQFVFATKLVHTINPHLPICDSMVVKFYRFKPPTSGDIADRIDKLIRFYNSLKQEYERVRNEEILNPAIHAFRQRFNPQHFTEEKIIDSLIWASYLDQGGLLDAEIEI